MTKRSLLVIVVMVICMSLLSGLPGNAAVNVAVLPFRIEGGSDLSFLGDGIRTIVSSRMGLPGKLYVLEESKIEEALQNHSGALDPETARSIGYQLDADFLVLGTIVQGEALLTIKGKILPVKQEGTPVSISRECSHRDGVIPTASGLAKELREKIVGFDKATPVSFANAPDTDVEALQEEKIFPGEEAGRVPQQKPDFEPSTSPSPGPLSDSSVESESQELGKISLNYWRSKGISHVLRGLAVGDADGDGNKEIVCITKRRLLVYRKKGDEIKEVAEHKENRSADFFRINMIDGDGNGIDEVFVTNRGGGTPTSLVLEYGGEEFEKKVTTDDWAFGVLHFPGEGPVLLGQVLSAAISDDGQIQRLRWDGAGYVSSGTSPIPSGIDLHSVGVLGTKGSGNKEFVALDNEGRLHVYDRDGNVKWNSEELYTGSLISPSLSTDDSSDKEDQKSSFPLRLITKNLNSGQKNDIILGKNFTKSKGLLRRKSVYESGSVYGLRWNGYNMDTRWHTERLDEILVDYAIGDVDNDGKDELVLAVQGARSRITLRPKCFILIYEIT